MNSPCQPFIALNESNFEQRVLQSKKPVVVEVRADWSGSCHIMEPVLEALAAQYDSRITFTKMDIATEERMAVNLGVTDLPFILFFHNGRLVDHLIGLLPRKCLSRRIEAFMYNVTSRQT